MGGESCTDAHMAKAIYPLKLPLWFSKKSSSYDTNSMVHTIGFLTITIPDSQVSRDSKKWSLMANGCYTVKSLILLFSKTRGIICKTTNLIWRSPYPKKICVFNWLPWNNSILILDALSAWRCNRLPTATCVMCNAGIETVDHYS